MFFPVLFFSCIGIEIDGLVMSGLCIRAFVSRDNGTISPVIQTTNGSRVPSSRPRTDVRPKGKDTMSNAEHKVERIR